MIVFVTILTIVPSRSFSISLLNSCNAAFKFRYTFPSGPTYTLQYRPLLSYICGGRIPQNTFTLFFLISFHTLYCPSSFQCYVFLSHSQYSTLANRWSVFPLFSLACLRLNKGVRGLTMMLPLRGNMAIIPSCYTNVCYILNSSLRFSQ